MRVLHLPTEIAGQVNLSVTGLRKIGIDAKNTARPNPFGYPVDIDPRFSKIPFLKKTRNPFLMAKWYEEFDLFHYHKSSYLPWGRDVKQLVKRGKPFVIEFWGSDIRLSYLERERNPYFIGDNSDNLKRKLDRLGFWSTHTDEVIMSDHSADNVLEKYFQKIHIVGQRVDTSRYSPNYPSPESSRPKIVHAPSSKAIKGTIHVINAIDKLKRSGLDFEYIEVSGVTHQKAMEIYSEADIIIDQMLLGSHGVFACEAMALGKPVICYIMDKLIGTYPEGFPIINANPDTLEEVLEDLINDPMGRYKIGKLSRKYAEDVHDIEVIAKKLEAIYLSKLST
jgi:glycosyltransferase involved in cell wall biosynthesis